MLAVILGSSSVFVVGDLSTCGDLYHRTVTSILLFHQWRATFKHQRSSIDPEEK